MTDIQRRSDKPRKRSTKSANGHDPASELVQAPSARSAKGGAQGKTKPRAKTKTPPQRSVCVYCGSGSGKSPIYAEAARTLGQALAASGIGLVYGGGSLGLMGEVARSTLKAGGSVTGIIPAFLSEKEKMLRNVDELIVVEDMHERKRLMFERSDGFVALPGGIGTLEELVEQLTWSQLGRHQKPIVLADIGNFWQPFLKLLGHMRDETFIRRGLEVSFRVVESAEHIVPALQHGWGGAVASETPTDRAITAKF